ncbi:MAG: glycosyltransferase [Hydrogenimonas sp.]|nr:glycosyltransferase [Hydrogenimonas sp.]
MRVLIHALPTKMGGAKRHLESMVNALAKASREDEFIVIVDTEYDTSVFDKMVRFIRFPQKYSSGFRRIIVDNLHINNIIKKENIDLLISFSNIGPIRAKCRHILFEMNALYFCKNIRSMYRLKSRVDFAIKRGLIKLCAKNADLIVTPSKSLMHTISEDLNIRKERFEVIYHAMEPEFLAAHQKCDIFNEERVSFLYPSHLARHKGVDTLLDALVQIKESNKELMERFEIVCTFDRRDEPEYFDELQNRISQNYLQRTIRFIGRQPQESMNSLYAAADYMIYTTMCESFGFSMLEAKVFHLPALCSDIAINREISKASAHYYRCGDHKDLAQKIEEFVLDRPEDFTFDDELLAWRWNKYANRLLAVMKECANG